jgi:hypothetical protein
MVASTARAGTGPAPLPAEAPGEQQQGGEHEDVAVDGPLQALTRSSGGALGPARRRYTPLHGRLLSLW